MTYQHGASRLHGLTCFYISVSASARNPQKITKGHRQMEAHYISGAYAPASLKQKAYQFIFFNRLSDISGAYAPASLKHRRRCYVHRIFA